MSSKPAIAVSERKNSLKTFDFFRFSVRMNVKRRPSDDKTKNIAERILTYNSKNCHLLNKKLDLKRTLT